MGLDVSLRLRRLGATPRMGYMGHMDEYDDADVERIDCDFQGRTEFAVIREWVGQKRYGEYIPLDEAATASLKTAIETEIDRRNREEEFYVRDGDAPYYLFDGNQWGLTALYAMIVRAPAALRCGWVLEIECDW